LCYAIDFKTNELGSRGIRGIGTEQMSTWKIKETVLLQCSEVHFKW
jgi:hypothetical protein